MAACSRNSSARAISAVSGSSGRLRDRGAVARLQVLDLFEVLDLDHGGRAVLAQPVVSGVADDGERPGPAVGARKPRNPAQRPQAGLLHHVLGIGAVSHHPARQRIGVVEVGQHHVGEPRVVCPAHTASRSGFVRVLPGRPARARAIFRTPPAGNGAGRIGTAGTCRRSMHADKTGAAAVLFPHYSAAAVTAAGSASMKPPDCRRHSMA